MILTFVRTRTTIEKQIRQNKKKKKKQKTVEEGLVSMRRLVVLLLVLVAARAQDDLLGGSGSLVPFEVQSDLSNLLQVLPSEKAARWGRVFAKSSLFSLFFSSQSSSVNHTVWDTDELVDELDRLRNFHLLCDKGSLNAVKAAGWASRAACDNALYDELIKTVVVASRDVEDKALLAQRIIDLCMLRFGGDGKNLLARFERERKRLFTSPNTEEECHNEKACLSRLEKARHNLMHRFVRAWPNTVEADAYMKDQESYIVRECPKLPFYKCEYARFNFRFLLEIKANLTKKEVRFLERANNVCQTSLCRSLTSEMREERRSAARADEVRAARQPAGREDPSYVIPGIVVNSLQLVVAVVLLAFGLAWRILPRLDVVMLSAVAAISCLSIVFFSTLLTGYDIHWTMSDIHMIQGLYNRMDLLLCFLLLLLFLTNWTAAVCVDMFDKPVLRKAVIVGAAVLAAVVSAFTVAMIVVHSLSVYGRFSLCVCLTIDVSLFVLPILTAMEALLALACCFVVLQRMKVRSARVAVLRMTVVVGLVSAAAVLKVGIVFYVRFGFYAVPRWLKFYISYNLCDFIILGAVLFIVGATVARAFAHKTFHVADEQPLLERNSQDRVPDQYQI